MKFPTRASNPPVNLPDSSIFQPGFSFEVPLYPFYRFESLPASIADRASLSTIRFHSAKLCASASLRLALE